MKPCKHPARTLSYCQNKSKNSPGQRSSGFGLGFWVNVRVRVRVNVRVRAKVRVRVRVRLPLPARYSIQKDQTTLGDRVPRLPGLRVGGLSSLLSLVSMPSTLDLTDVPYGLLVGELQRRLECATKPERRVVLLGPPGTLFSIYILLATVIRYHSPHIVFVHFSFRMRKGNAVASVEARLLPLPPRDG